MPEFIPLTADAVEGREFGRTSPARGKPPGYDMDEVREFIDQVARSLDYLDELRAEDVRNVEGWQEANERVNDQLAEAERRVRAAEGERAEELKLARAQQAAAGRRLAEQAIADGEAKGRAEIEDARAKVAEILAGMPPEDRRLPPFPTLVDDQVTDDLAEVEWYRAVEAWAREASGSVRERLLATVSRIQEAVGNGLHDSEETP